MNVRYTVQDELPLAHTPATTQARQIIDRCQQIGAAAVAAAKARPTLAQVRDSMDHAEATGQDPERWDGMG